MMIFNKAIPRRTFLRGLGAAIALPWLDSMAPAFAAQSDVSAQTPLRLGFVYVPNGIIREDWLPASAGAQFETTNVLRQWTPYRDQMLVLSGMDGGPQFVGGHVRGSSMWLTGAEPKQSMNDVRSGVSVDQVVARQFGKDTQLESLELCIENAAELAGQSAGGYSAAYTNTIAWRTPTLPLPMEHRPRAVFERLFGDGDSTDSAARLARIRKQRSILDFVNQDVNRVMASLGASDQGKLNEFLESIRGVEARVEKAEAQSSKELPQVERPIGIPVYEEHVKLMFDLLHLAYQTDLTRVSTFMLAREYSELVYTQIGHTEPHHPLTHHRGIPVRMKQAGEVNQYHAKLFAYFLEKMKSTQEAGGSLLDHSMLIYGAGMGDADIHNQWNLPIALFGGARGQLKGGRHIQSPKGTPLSNLHVAVLELAGIPTEKFGLSNGKLDLHAAA
jgi:hypothetical protein